jgi:hypothetical protein
MLEIKQSKMNKAGLFIRYGGKAPSVTQNCLLCQYF